jgi:hypothetical protein
MSYILKLFPVLFIISVSCEKQNFITNNTAKLAFSNDTVYFDTVFTTIGSTTQSFMVYNKHSKPINITSIRLVGGSNSPFKININGVPVSNETNIEIAAKDSMYIFVQVMINPNNINSPLFVSDSILFETNGNLQKVILVAWGQDVHLLKNVHLKTQTWPNDKPYLVYGTIYVDTSQVLTIEQGTKIYFHKNAGLIVDGSIIVNGTLSNHVVFRGDRLDKALSDLPYDEIPAQWNYIWLRNASRGNKFNYADIRNAVTGIYVGAIGWPGEPDLELANCKIENNSYAGILAVQSKIKGYNCLIDNCGSYGFAAIVGGSYQFYQTTFANYYALSRTNGSVNVILSNSYKLQINNDSVNIDTSFNGDLKQAYFGNCIIYGSSSYELFIVGVPGYQLNYQFEYCLIKYDINNNIDTSYINVADQTKFTRNIFSTNDCSDIQNGCYNGPVFNSTYTYKWNFELDSLSLAKDAGSLDIARLYPFDYYQKSRLSDNGPDMGAFEK